MIAIASFTNLLTGPASNLVVSPLAVPESETTVVQKGKFHQVNFTAEITSLASLQMQEKPRLLGLTSLYPELHMSLGCCCEWQTV